jgi:hypothetical protein
MSPPQPVRRRRQREAGLSDDVVIVDRARLIGSLGDLGGRSQETDMTKRADSRQRVRGRMAKTGESYAAARAHVLADRPHGGVQPRALHLTNGDCTVPGLRGTGLAQIIVPWRDVLREGCS